MFRIFWEVLFLISGSLYTFGGGDKNSTIIRDTNSTSPLSQSVTSVHITSATTGVSSGPALQSDFYPVESDHNGTTGPSLTLDTNSSTSSTTTATTSFPPVKKFVVAAVRSHFDDCPDSHRHFCFHGTCRFLVLEETAACVCHPGFVGMRCEHADLLAVVATNHQKQTVATVLVLCVIGCVLIMLLCTLLNCWWRRECRRRRSQARHYEKSINMLKHGTSHYPPESVV
ncbi:protransforming growth factor alpha [Synchiropus splendidus]|uniref:protransforming growth factor alpha n=1 Tax=Synchiropus splendidus TaxID=270530 RepID=UPI00237EE3C1|nr:protransforming growth factor alpha [Synchiropus splendidus]